jgi:hypothetical protein
MTNLETACDDFYNGFAGLPRTDPQTFTYWWGGSNYNIFIERSNKQRREVWNELLPKYYTKYQLLASEDNGIQVKVRNTLFHSYCEIVDKNKNEKRIVYTPWYSAFLRLFFGGDLIIERKMKLKV